MTSFGRLAISVFVVVIIACMASAAVASSMLITDFYTPDIMKIDLETGASSVFTTLTLDSGDYSGGIAYNPADGKVYVGTSKGKIWSYNVDGTGEQLFFSTPNNYYSQSLTVGNGVLYAVDAVRRKVVKYDSAGNETEYSASMGDETRYQQMTVGPDGNIYLAASDTSSVLRVLPDGTVETWLSNQPTIEGVAFDAAGNLSVMRQEPVWTNYNKIWNYSPTGDYIDYRLTFNSYHASNLLYSSGGDHLYQLGLGGLGRYGFLIDCETSSNSKTILYEKWNGMFLDMTMIPSVPEPGAMVSLMAGLAGLGGLALRRRK